MLRTVHYRLLAVLWTIGIVVAVAVPTGNLPKMETGLGIDKIVHVVLFAGFGLLWLRGLCPPTEAGFSSRFWGRSLILFLVGVLFAGGTEVFQHLAPVRRLGTLFDAVADLFGLLVAFGGFYVYHGYLAKRIST